APSFLWVVFGTRRPQQVTRNLDFLRHKGISLLTASVASIDPAGRVVRTSRGNVAGDSLVLALGAELAPERMPGFEAAHTFYTLPGAVALRRTLEGFAGGRVVFMIASTPFRCPAAPYEGAFMMDAYLRKRGLRDRSPITVITPEPQPMPVARPAIGSALVDMMRARGIAYRPKAKPEAIVPEERVLVLAGGERIPYDLLIGVPPHIAPAAVRDSGLTDASGYVPVGPRTLETQHEGVYAIGDVAAIKLPNGMMLPKAGVFAHYEAEVVARNIAARLAGDDRANYDGRGACWVEVGNGRAAFGSGNFYADPAPAIALKPVSRYQHWRKIAFEKWFLRKWT
ncbi:MAG: NAD(P)/FAD-dependent oxidoreductase, partial [Euryarchaeota archaeon]|nr:NAD(P)/FAD-dependent oxidoreductase [Euryarchaeota archaeon]